MSLNATDLFITVNSGTDSDSEELDELTRQLLDELAELHLLLVELARGGKLPEGAKGEPIGVGTILVKIAEAGGITGLVSVLGSWLSRDKRRALKLQIGDNKLEVTGITRGEQARLIKWFQIQTGLRLEA
jgi:hypothetical protein